MKKLVIPIGLMAVFVGAPASANSNASTDLAAPYVHLAPTNTYTTHYVVTNTNNSAVNISVKCFSTDFRLVGSPIPIPTFSVGPGTSYTAAANAINVFDPVSLGLTSSPNFTGLGWCYFAANQDIAVTYLMGVSIGGNLIPTNDARGISLDTAQGSVSNWHTTAPYWTKEAGWKSYLFAINPTTNSSLNVKMRVYNTFGNLEGTYVAPASGPFTSTVNSGRGITIVDIPNSVGTAAVFGSAQITEDSPTLQRGFMGWVLGYNYVSNESFQYAIPVGKFDDVQLGAADRP